MTRSKQCKSNYCFDLRRTYFNSCPCRWTHLRCILANMPSKSKHQCIEYKGMSIVNNYRSKRKSHYCCCNLTRIENLLNIAKLDRKCSFRRTAYSLNSLSCRADMFHLLNILRRHSQSRNATCCMTEYNQNCNWSKN